jgi:hypothetical protein
MTQSADAPHATEIHMMREAQASIDAMSMKREPGIVVWMSVAFLISSRTEAGHQCKIPERLISEGNCRATIPVHSQAGPDDDIQLVASASHGKYRFSWRSGPTQREYRT